MTYDTSTPLPAGHAVAFDAAFGETVFCADGALWITQGDGKDYILNAGERLSLAPRDTVVVTGMSDGAIALRLKPAMSVAA